MPIEFQCTHCSTLLRVPDDSAGRQARCPKCGNVLPIPAQGALPAVLVPETPFAPNSPLGPASTLSPDDAQNPYASPAAYVGSLAGEGPFEFGPIVPTPLDVGDALGRAWRLYIANLGFCLLLMLCFCMILGIVWAIFFAAIMFAGAGIMEVGNQGHGELPAVMVALMFLIWLPVFFLFLWLHVGMLIALLNLCRGRPAQIGDLFSGGRYVWRFAGVSLAWGLPYLLLIGLGVGLVAGLAAARVDTTVLLMTGAAIVPFVVPVAVFMLTYFPATYLVIDHDMGFSESFSTAGKIMRGNRLMFFLLLLLAGAIHIGAQMVPCVGLFMGFAVAPLNTLLLLIGYLRMSGQPTAGGQI